MANRYQPHILILSEDDANKDIVNGFMLDERVDLNHVVPLPVAGGWRKLINEFSDRYAPHLQKYPNGIMFLVLDFDGDQSRREYVLSAIPHDLSDRVFVIGALSEPEDLCRSLRMSKEQVGRALAEECAEDNRSYWSHPLLKHNNNELDRFARCRDILWKR